MLGRKEAEEIIEKCINKINTNIKLYGIILSRIRSIIYERF